MQYAEGCLKLGLLSDLDDDEGVGAVFCFARRLELEIDFGEELLFIVQYCPDLFDTHSFSA